MNLIGRPPVVAGVDGSSRDLATLRRAVLAARQHDVPLRVVHVVGPDLAACSGVLLLARQIVEDAGGVPEADYDLRAGTPAGALLCPAMNATLLVLGAPAPHRPPYRPSVAEQLAAASPVPVLAVRRDGAGGPVVAALDGSATSAHVLAYAIELADLDGRRLRVVHAGAAPGAVLPPDLDVLLRSWSAKFPEVEVDVAVEAGDPAERLVECSSRAGLLVLGSRPPGHFAANLLGAVSRNVLYGADCDVAVV